MGWKWPAAEHALDPHDADSRYFVGRMKFHEAQRVADALRERLSKGAGGVELACQCFDMYHVEGPA